MAKKKKGRRGRRPAGSNGAASDQFTETELLQAKRLADQMGGIDKAKAVIDVLAKIT
jgi:hypothetical protein